MEKQNFKNKVNGAVIDKVDYNILTMDLKNGFYLSSEEPTHNVGIENGKPFIAPIILKKETKTVNASEETTGEELTKEQVEQSTVNGPPAGKTKKTKVKGEKN